MEDGIGLLQIETNIFGREHENNKVRLRKTENQMFKYSLF